MSHLPKNHPVRFLIESATNGRRLTAEDLEILKHAPLPTGESLTEYKAAVDSAARQVAAAAAGGDQQTARQLAETKWSSIAAGMSEAQLAVDGTTGPDDQQAIATMVSHVFEN